MKMKIRIPSFELEVEVSSDGEVSIPTPTPAPIPTPSPVPTPAKFEVILSTNQNPDILPPYITRMHGVYAQEFLIPKTGHLTSVDWVKLDNAVQTKSVGQKYLFLDIEHWDINKFQTEQTRKANCLALKAVMARAKSKAPNTRIGWYGLCPILEFWSTILAAQGKPAQIQELVDWRILNDKNFEDMKPLDLIMPPLYHRDGNLNHWESFARANIIEAQRIAQKAGAHVVPYLSPKLYISGVESYAPVSFLETQIKFVKSMGCEGVVIWNWDPAVPVLDYTVPWWKMLKDLAQTL
jgi:hypothetical protein